MLAPVQLWATITSRGVLLKFISDENISYLISIPYRSRDCTCENVHPKSDKKGKFFKNQPYLLETHWSGKLNLVQTSTPPDGVTSLSKRRPERSSFEHSRCFSGFCWESAKPSVVVLLDCCTNTQRVVASIDPEQKAKCCGLFSPRLQFYWTLW